MGFTDFVSDAGLKLLDTWAKTHSYIAGYSPSQADVVTFKAVPKEPNVASYPHAYRWYNHIKSYESEFASLPGDPSKSYSVYGPEAAAVNPKDAPAADDDDDVDLFGSDDEEEDPDVVAEREKNLAAYKAKKEAKGPKPAAKSIVTLDVKPWDDETDMAELVAGVKAIEMDGLVWGGHQLIPVGKYPSLWSYGIKKLQINCVVEDEKVSIDDLQEKIAEDEDHVQSSDVAAMQKL